LKEDVNLGALAQEDCPGPDQRLEADVAFGGRFGLKEDVNLGALAQEDCPCPDQLLEADIAFGGRSEPKFMPGARIPAAAALAKEVLSDPPAMPFMLRGPIEPAQRLPT